MTTPPPQERVQPFDWTRALAVTYFGAAPAGGTAGQPTLADWQVCVLKVMPLPLFQVFGTTVPQQQHETPHLVLTPDMAAIIVAQILNAAKATGWDTRLNSLVDQQLAALRGLDIGLRDDDR